MRALALYEELRDARGEALAASALANVLMALGRSGEACEFNERSLTRFRALGDRRSEALAMGNIGIALWQRGRLAEAQERHERHLRLAREIGDRAGEAMATGNLGAVAVDLGRLRESGEHNERALGIARAIGDRLREASYTGNRGSLLQRLGRLDEARTQYERELALSRDIGNPLQEGYALHGLGDVLAETGDARAAEYRYTEALDLRRRVDRHGEGMTLASRGALMVLQRREPDARADLDAALAIAGELSLPTFELLATAWLAQLPDGDIGAALAALASHEGRAGVQEAMEARFLLWRATHDPVHLAEAKRRLDFLVEHAPPECRESMLANVRLHREITEAWAAHGADAAAAAGDARG